MLFEVAAVIIGMALVVLAVLYLRRRGVLHTSHSGFVETLLMQIVLPADTLFDLSQAGLKPIHLMMILTMLSASIINLTLGYLVGRLLRLRRPEIGALMLAVGFAETALLAAPLLKSLYPGQAEMWADITMTSEIGMVLPTLILGPIIAQLFGEGERKETPARLVLSAIWDYLRSPLCIALILGLFIAATNIHFGAFLSETVGRMLEAAGSGLTLLSLVLIGLMLKPTFVRRFWPALVVVVIMQQIADPLVITGSARLFALKPAELEVMRILSLTPAALVTPVFAARYKCAPEFSAALTFVSMAAVIVLFPLMYGLLS